MQTQVQPIFVEPELQSLRDPLPTHHIQIEQIQTKPIWSVIDLSIICDCPTSTLNQVIAENPAPFFLLGRRKVIFREDALKWLREVADRNPWQPRRNNRTQ